MISFDCAAPALSEKGTQNLAGLFIRVVADIIQIPDQTANTVNLISQQDLQSLQTEDQAVSENSQPCADEASGAKSGENTDVPRNDASAPIQREQKLGSCPNKMSVGESQCKASGRDDEGSGCGCRLRSYARDDAMIAERLVLVSLFVYFLVIFVAFFRS